LTCSGQPDSDPATIPPIIPVMSPAAGGAPEAIAMPIHRGNATRKTTTEERASCFRLLKSDITSLECPLPGIFSFRFHVAVTPCEQAMGSWKFVCAPGRNLLFRASNVRKSATCNLVGIRNMVSPQCVATIEERGNETEAIE